MSAVYNEESDDLARVLDVHQPSPGGWCGALRCNLGRATKWPCLPYRLAEENAALRMERDDLAAQLRYLRSGNVSRSRALGGLGFDPGAA